ncbi:MAG: GNAT family N-acetyltransferase [Myxococcota bacterium]
MSSVAQTSTVRGLMSRMRLAPLRIPEDMGTVHSWVRQDYARFWGMHGLSLEQVTEGYREIVAPADVEAFLGHFDDAAAFLIETYHPSLAPFAGHYDAAASDRGMHVLVAPPDRPIRGFTRAVFCTVMDFLFDDAQVRRVVVEPDARNDKIRALNRFAGFVELKEIDIEATATAPGKRAMLSICTREAYAGARP